jgi:hypothetical protein
LRPSGGEALSSNIPDDGLRSGLNFDFLDPDHLRIHLDI